MVEAISLIGLAVVMLFVFNFLYNQGYMVSKSMSAVAFVGAPKGNGASFSSCSGYMKRVIKFKEDASVTFTLDAQLSKGDMSVELIDSSGEMIMQLNCANRNACVTVEKTGKYYLVTRFIAATGRYTLTREEVV